MRVLVMLLTGLVLLSLLVACMSIPTMTPAETDTPSPSATQEPQPYAVDVDASYDGKTVEVPSGCWLRVSLGSNQTTGYQWVLVEISDRGVVELVDTTYLPSPSSLSGTGGKELWTFQTLHEGSSLIAMEYRQPWEQGVEPAHTFGLNVVVQ